METIILLLICIAVFCLLDYCSSKVKEITHKSIIEIIKQFFGLSSSKEAEEYYKSAYYIYTQNSYEKIMNDKGLYGEYKTYQQLKWLEMYGAKFLYNVYIPKDDGTTTEIDLLLITTKGVFVIESKNYSGYIYGRVDDYKWTQVLNKNSKYQFYNPIKQNEGHIKYLKKQLSIKAPIYSLIVFSERCVLKNVPNHTDNVAIIKRDRLVDLLKFIVDNQKNDVISHRDIDVIQKELFLFSQKTDCEKAKHAEDIKKHQIKVKVEDKIRKKLIIIRKEISNENRISAFCVYKDDIIEKIVQLKPKTIEELSQILSSEKVKKYGKGIISIINDCYTEI